MALVNLVNVMVLDNPSTFGDPFQFEITFECLQELEEDLEWKVIYVGSAQDTTHDQTLEEVLVGPVPVGINKFVLAADAPDVSTIPHGDILGVTVLLLTASYREKEFVRVGYYVNNEYHNPEEEEGVDEEEVDMVAREKALVEDPSKVRRQILADKPRVTRFPIDWGTSGGEGGAGGENANREGGNPDDEEEVIEEEVVEEADLDDEDDEEGETETATQGDSQEDDDEEEQQQPKKKQKTDNEDDSEDIDNDDEDEEDEEEDEEDDDKSVALDDDEEEEDVDDKDEAEKSGPENDDEKDADEGGEEGR